MKHISTLGLMLINRIAESSGEENPRETLEKPLQPKQVTVWCGFWARGIIGFFEDKAGNKLTATGRRYRSMIENFAWDQLVTEIQQLWFQQDDATPHTNNLMKRRFRILETIVDNRGYL